MMEEDATHEAGAEDHATGTEVAHGAPAESGGMPQLNPDFFGNQIFWLVLALVSIWLILSRVALPRIGAILATRAGSIGNDLAAAEALRAQAREAQAAHDKALADARAEAARIAAEARAEVQRGLDADLAAADARIDAKAAESARRLSEIAAESDASVTEVARDAARAVLEAMGGRVDDAALDAAVARRMGS
jgi:F-type H+-transporting ATPase subunit b